MRGQIAVRLVLTLTLTVLGGIAGGVGVRAESPPAPPPRGEAARQALLDQLDDARVNCELLELEVESLRAQIRTMMTVLRDSELTPLQGFSQGPVIGSGNGLDRERNITNYKHKLDRVCGEFAVKSKELFRERRRVAELEAQVGPGVAAASPPGPAPASERAARVQKEAERLLDLIRKGVESWRRDSPAEPEERPGPNKGRPESGSEPDPDLLKDAERLLDLIRRGVEAWQGR
jgi:hypothetical protein